MSSNRLGPGTFQMARAASDVADPLPGNSSGKVKTVPVNLLNRHTKRVLGRPDGWEKSEFDRLRQLNQGQSSNYKSQRDRRQELEREPYAGFQPPPGSLLLKTSRKTSSTRSGGTAAGSVTASSSNDGEDAPGRRAMTQHYRALLLGEDNNDDLDPQGKDLRDSLAGGALSRSQANMWAKASRDGRAEDFLRPARKQQPENKLISKYKANIVPRGMKRPPHTYFTDLGPPQQDHLYQSAQGQLHQPYQQIFQQQQQHQQQYPQHPFANGSPSSQMHDAPRPPRAADHTAKYFQYTEEDLKSSVGPNHGNPFAVKSANDQARSSTPGDDVDDVLPPRYHEQHPTSKSTAGTRSRRVSTASRKREDSNTGLTQSEFEDEDEDEEDEEEEEEEVEVEDGEEDIDEESEGVDEEEEDDEESEEVTVEGEDEDEDFEDENSQSRDDPSVSKYLEMIAQLTEELERAQDRIADLEQQREEEQDELESELEELDKGNLDLKGQTVALQRQVLHLTSERQDNLEEIQALQDENVQLRADCHKMEQIAKVLHKKAAVLQQRLGQEDSRQLERAAERRAREQAGGSPHPVETMEDAMDRIAELESLNEALRAGLAQGMSSRTNPASTSSNNETGPF